jgi:hypothetical protein
LTHRTLRLSCVWFAIAQTQNSRGRTIRDISGSLIDDNVTEDKVYMAERSKRGKRREASGGWTKIAVPSFFRSQIARHAGRPVG